MFYNITEPIFEITELNIPGIEDRKVNDKLRLIADYSVIEKTKSFTTIRINFAYQFNSARKY